MIDLRGSITIAADGDVAGHEFHGNQHTGGSSANKSAKASKAAHSATKQAMNYKGTNEQKSILHERAQGMHDKAAKEAGRASRDKDNSKEQRATAKAAQAEHQQLSAGHGKMLDKLDRPKSMTPEDHKNAALEHIKLAVSTKGAEAQAHMDKAAEHAQKAGLDPTPKKTAPEGMKSRLTSAAARSGTLSTAEKSLHDKAMASSEKAFSGKGSHEQAARDHIKAAMKIHGELGQEHMNTGAEHSIRAGLDPRSKGEKPKGW